MTSNESFFERAFGEFRGRAFFVALGCLICQMGLGLTYIRTGMAPELIEGIGLTRTELSGAATPQLIFQALASPVVGLLAVRLGASRVLAISAALFAFVFFGFSRTESLGHLYVVVAGIGLCAAGMGDITVGHVVSQWFHRNRGLALGIAYAGSNLGGSVMVALVSEVASRATWREGLLAIVPVALFVLLPTALFMVREPGVGHDTESGTGDQAAPRGEERDVDLRHALRTRSFWILTGTLFTFFFFFTGILDSLVLFLVDSGLPKNEARAYFGQAVGLGVLMGLFAGVPGRRLSARPRILLRRPLHGRDLRRDDAHPLSGRRPRPDLRGSSLRSARQLRPRLRGLCLAEPRRVPRAAPRPRRTSPGIGQGRRGISPSGRAPRSRRRTRYRRASPSCGGGHSAGADA